MKSNILKIFSLFIVLAIFVTCFAGCSFGKPSKKEIISALEDSEPRSGDEEGREIESLSIVWDELDDDIYKAEVCYIATSLYMREEYDRVVELEFRKLNNGEWRLESEKIID